MKHNIETSAGEQAGSGQQPKTNARPAVSRVRRSGRGSVGDRGDRRSHACRRGRPGKVEWASRVPVPKSVIERVIWGIESVIWQVEMCDLA